MIAAGYKVAICEQMEDPKTAKGLIKREVTRLVTPGTLTEEAMLDGREENFLAAVVADRWRGRRAEPKPGSGLAAVAIAWCELSTGKFLTLVGSPSRLLEELSRIHPRELIYPES